MSPVKREKVGFRERFIAALGKYIMFWRSKKSSKLLVDLSHREVIRALKDIHGDLETALKSIFQMAVRSADQYLMEWIERAAPIFSRNVADHTLWIKSGYYSFTGDKIKYMEYIPPANEGDPHKVIWRVEECLLCSGMKEDSSFKVSKDELGEMGWGAGMAGIFQATTNLINDYAGIPFEAKCRETKCMMKGDPYGEFTIEFYPKKESQE